MNAGADHAAALAHSLQGFRYQFARRREDNGAIDAPGRFVAGVAGPVGAQRQGKLLGVGVAGPGKSHDALAAIPGHLDEDVGSGAEAVEGDGVAVLQQPVGTVADQAGAEQGGSQFIGVILRNGETVAGVRHRVFGKAAVDLVARVARLVAEVFALVPAEPAVAAAVAEPRNADPLSGFKVGNPVANPCDPAHDLVPRNQRQYRRFQVGIDDMQVGPANPAGGDLHQQLARCRFGAGYVLQSQRLAGAVEDHGSHRQSPVCFLRSQQGLAAAIRH